MTQQGLTLKVPETRGCGIVPIWVERFAFAVLAAVFVGVVILNVLKMDWIQRTGLGTGILGFSIFLAQTVHLSNKAKVDTSQQSEPKKPDVQQSNQGSNNTNIVGNNNTVINNPPSRPPQPSFHEKNESTLVTFSFGENGIIDHETVARLRKETYAPFRFGQDYTPVMLHLKGDTLLLHFKVWGGKGASPIEVKDNEFTVRLEGFDRNSSANALEVINPAGEPIFQMIRKTPTHIIVNGIFPTPAGIVLAGPTGFLTGAKPQHLAAFHLKPIFKYPSWKYPGQYAAD